MEISLIPLFTTRKKQRVKTALTLQKGTPEEEETHLLISDTERRKRAREETEHRGKQRGRENQREEEEEGGWMGGMLQPRLQCLCCRAECLFEDVWLLLLTGNQTPAPLHILIALLSFDPANRDVTWTTAAAGIARGDKYHNLSGMG
ncbi:hypothetical protein NQZ68_034582 [Dissostichus eleginoides]|nr:hypothetical protein NQZ68_034582 [Dissostichus eleginoides]